ncbi:MAG: hypothetical protein QOE97_2759 [Pseudonocardiales bacterium]|nr:hypothetical protein [Pseudonocardiales bacterium]
MAEHRVSVLGGSLRRFEDPEHSRDPRIRLLVLELRQLESAPAPRAHFRAELRSQLVAVAPRLVAEGVSAEVRPAGRHAAANSARSARSVAPEATSANAASRARRRPAFGRLTAVSIARPIAVAAAIVAVFALVLGGAVWVSKKSLPGDTLYSLKRANENVKLSLTSGGTAKGKQYLDLAAARAAEVADLLKRSSALAAGTGTAAATGVSPHTAGLVNDTLNSADEDVRDAAKLLGTEAVTKKSAAPLSVLTGWAPGQLQLLKDITDRLPAGSLHDRAAGSTRLVDDALGRGAALQGLLGCSCLANAPSDDLGPVPCTVCSVAPPALPTVQVPTIVPSVPPGAGSSQTPNVPGTGRTTSGTGSAGTGTSGTGTVVDPTTGGSPSSSGGKVSLPQLSLPPITLPTVTLPTPTTSTPTPTPTPTPKATSSCSVNLFGLLCVPKF